VLGAGVAAGRAVLREEIIMTFYQTLVLIAVAGAVVLAHGEASAAGGVERMYVLGCGENRTSDVSRWSPGVNVGEPRVFSNNCYLIKHAKDWMLWDTGNADSIAALPDGLVAAGGRLVMRMPRTLASQLVEIGVRPEDIKRLALSHMHRDHTGNANLFTAATLYMQEAEYDAAFGPDAAKYGFDPTSYAGLRHNPVVKLHGDHDVFGDGSVVIKSTPGHTIGHQSLLVRLPRTGPVLLSGDFVHFEDNWVHKRVPSMNYDAAQTAQTMRAVETFLAQTGATLWINHDNAQSDRIPRAPAYVE
jgi:glyoxylase-like metal-dependent hydrolase (beta-lactamase superfamily II)